MENAPMQYNLGNISETNPILKPSLFVVYLTVLLFWKINFGRGIPYLSVALSKYLIISTWWQEGVIGFMDSEVSSHDQLAPMHFDLWWDLKMVWWTNVFISWHPGNRKRERERELKTKRWRYQKVDIVPKNLPCWLTHLHLLSFFNFTIMIQILNPLTN